MRWVVSVVFLGVLCLSTAFLSEAAAEERFLEGPLDVEVAQDCAALYQECVADHSDPRNSEAICRDALAICIVENALAAAVGENRVG